MLRNLRSLITRSKLYNFDQTEKVLMRMSACSRIPTSMGEDGGKHLLGRGLGNGCNTTAE